MRLKQLWSHCDLPAKTNLVWSRITFSRLTIAYFSLAVIHCIIQTIFQVQAFSINAGAASKLWTHVTRANKTHEGDGFVILSDDLRLCYQVDSISTQSCEVIWNPGNNSGPPQDLAVVTPPASSLAAASSSLAATAVSASAATSIASASASATPSPALPTTPAARPSSSSATALLESASSSPSKTTVVIRPSPNAGKATTVVITLNDDDDDEDEDEVEDDDKEPEHIRRSLINVSSNVVARDFDGLNDTCIKALLWPVQRLSDTKREDITFIMFQIWVLGMSIVALLNESIPHTVAALVTHLLATAWAVYQIFETDNFRQNFAKVITNGACGVNLLGTYWDLRRNAEIASAVLNGAVLIPSAYMTFKLTKIYGWQTFKRVGASLTINRIYKVVLSLSISIQLGLFFIVSAMALWIDQLMYGAIAHHAKLATIYKAVFIAVFCLLIPWLALGWFSVRREKRKLAFVFLVISIVFFGLWAAMFKSVTFRWTFVTWTFFAVMASTAGVLMISTFLLGLACRLNFGKGLPRYLNAEEPLAGEDFTPVLYEKEQYDDDPEKVEFPSTNGRPVPTFSATFGRGLEVPRPAQMRFGPSHAPGTGKYDTSPAAQQELFQQQRGHVVGRSISSSSTHSGISEASLARTDTRGSDVTYQSSSSSNGRMGKRWVIE